MNIEHTIDKPYQYRTNTKKSMAKQYGEVAKDILKVLALGGAIAVGVTSPPLAKFLWETFFKDKTQQKNAEEFRKFSRQLAYLKKSRLVILKENQDGTLLVELSENGKRKVKEFQVDDLQIKRPSKWDGIWRIVIFDIPKKKSHERESFRAKLKDLGFLQLQESVWAFPYPCQQEIEFIVELFRVYPYVNFVEAAYIKDDLKLRKHFSLL
jgi:hypothetical protein